MTAPSNSTGCTPLYTASTRRPPKISLLPSPSSCVKRENSCRTPRAPRAPSTGASCSIRSFSFSSSPFFAAFARSFFPFRFLLLFRFQARSAFPVDQNTRRRDHRTPFSCLLFGILSRNLTTSGIAAQKEKGSRQRARAHVVHGISRCERVACSTRNDVRACFFCACFCVNNNKQIRENSNVRKRERILGQNSNVFFFPSRKTRSFLTPPSKN